MQASPREIMAIMAARELNPSEVVLVGVGIPNLAANLAKRLYHPDITLIYESGTIDSNPPRQPLSIGDSSLVEDVSSVFSVFETFSYIIQRGFVDVGFLGSAQVDVTGHINTTIIGKYEHPEVRLPGSGGACEISHYAKRKVIITTFSKLKIRKVVDFVTSSTMSNAGGSTGQESGSNSVKIITDICIINVDTPNGAEITHVYSTTDMDVLRNYAEEIGLSISETVEKVKEPTKEELDVLHALDTQGVYLK